MQFTETKLSGAYIIDLELRNDDRGFFARAFCKEEFGKHGLVTDLLQCNISFNKAKGTLRGMHYQTAPHQETKVIRCTMGSVYDVIVDIRPDSPTFLQWIGVELSAQNHRMIYVPRDFAHGYLTLDDACEVFYYVDAMYEPKSASGLRWDDPSIAIHWPTPPVVMSPADTSWELVKGRALSHG